MRELGLLFGEIDPIALKLGPIAVHWYGVIIGMAVLLALYLSIKEGERRGIQEDNFYDFLIVALPVAIICARIYYVVFEWNYYASNPAEIIRIWDGGIAIYGGLTGEKAFTVAFYGRYGSNRHHGARNRSLGKFFQSGSAWRSDDKSVFRTIVPTGFYH